ncbi:uncharacterized protein TNIN_225431 [Trichonephila inaurata madagascariensis]|uniref:DNA-directed DNA polymerase n=1 Tax=Trichonephila inaurata madagascariensis TaxID=2747483 RepID=A0A8X7CNI7_9ARAC|nr:uncharacterized protein TNIN_225431 [Trichonephila inaurata madagascariensis]
MACVTKFLQSKSEVRLDEGFNVEIITIRRPVGSKLKKSDLRSLREKDCCLLQRHAIALHQKTGVPQGPCGFEEIALFEQYLKIQVIVVSTTALNQVCYKGPVREDRRIYLWHHDNHFDVITSPKGFYGSNFFVKNASNHLITKKSKMHYDLSCMSGLHAKMGKANDALTAIGTRVLNSVSRRIRKMDFVINCINVGNAAKLSKKNLPQSQHQVWGKKGAPPAKAVAESHMCYLQKESAKNRDSIRWLDFVAHTEGHRILHALNGTGEQKIAGYSVDGFCKETNTVYQYQGCFHHGCENCYDGDLIHPLAGTTMRSLRQKKEGVTDALRQRGYNIIQMLEHDFVHLKKTGQFKEFLLQHEVTDRLNPRDAFFGGRTNGIKLFFEGCAKYIDFTSLYPWVNKYCEYPVGHPEIITEGFRDIDSYFGLVKCKVFPPRKLFHPVLPFRCNGKLMFPLCRTCAETLGQKTCSHTDEERSITGTWVTEEVKKARKKGYKIIKIYEVYHFQSSSKDLFRSYIDLFLKIKQEASGYPKGCLTEQQKSEYIISYSEKENISLDKNSINVNLGRRSVAKLALNSFWGRWGMNLNKNKLNFVSTVHDFNKMLMDKTKHIKDVFLPTPEIAAFQWTQNNNFVTQDSSTNIFIAAFTTCHARLKLYSEIEKLNESVLYFDTDSIIYKSDGINDPPLGNFLGEFTDELNGGTITSFVTGGPKNYAYKLSDGSEVCKIRGFTLNFQNSLVLNYDSVKELVSSMDATRFMTVTNPRKITRDKKKRKVENKEESKTYKMVYDKRIIQEDFSTLPYGY